MFQTIVMTRATGFAISTQAKYEDALEIAQRYTLADKQTTAVIYNGDGALIWRWFGNIVAPAPAPVAIETLFQVGPQGATKSDFDFALYPDAYNYASQMATEKVQPYDIWKNGGKIVTVHPPE
jgi:hypothetical protein